ncbi:unnamed protein product [Periconia digitata]|uniref:Uncharacterized protein n=1 Tax=Periconia digitata TaxID=1303443 RepID=A0A9W4UGH9_9PLEO|nr:unnamed protein product [Periconia digitata]
MDQAMILDFMSGPIYGFGSHRRPEMTDQGTDSGHAYNGFARGGYADGGHANTGYANGGPAYSGYPNDGFAFNGYTNGQYANDGYAYNGYTNGQYVNTGIQNTMYPAGFDMAYTPHYGQDMGMGTYLNNGVLPLQGQSQEQVQFPVVLTERQQNKLLKKAYDSVITREGMTAEEYSFRVQENLQIMVQGTGYVVGDGRYKHAGTSNGDQTYPPVPNSFVNELIHTGQRLIHNRDVAENVARGLSRGPISNLPVNPQTPHMDRHAQGPARGGMLPVQAPIVAPPANMNQPILDGIVARPLPNARIIPRDLNSTTGAEQVIAPLLPKSSQNSADAFVQHPSGLDDPFLGNESRQRVTEWLGCDDEGNTGGGNPRKRFSYSASPCPAPKRARQHGPASENDMMSAFQPVATSAFERNSDMDMMSVENVVSPLAHPDNMA